MKPNSQLCSHIFVCDKFWRNYRNRSVIALFVMYTIRYGEYGKFYKKKPSKISIHLLFHVVGFLLQQSLFSFSSFFPDVFIWFFFSNGNGNGNFAHTPIKIALQKKLSRRCRFFSYIHVTSRFHFPFSRFHFVCFSFEFSIIHVIWYCSVITCVVRLIFKKMSVEENKRKKLSTRSSWRTKHVSSFIPPIIFFGCSASQKI